VAHVYNPSYSGGGDQEDCSLKPAQANSSREPILKKTSQKRAGGVAQSEGSEFTPVPQKKKKKSCFKYVCIYVCTHTHIWWWYCGQHTGLVHTRQVSILSLSYTLSPDIHIFLKSLKLFFYSSMLIGIA
jgi:hypothetical protein